MMEYARLAKGYDAAKPLIDYARTLTTFFGLAAVAAVAFKAQFGPKQDKPDGEILDQWFAVSHFMFGLLVISIWAICGRLTYLLMLDMLFPAWLEKPNTTAKIIRFLIWVFSYLVVAGAGGIIISTVTAALA